MWVKEASDWGRCGAWSDAGASAGSSAWARAPVRGCSDCRVLPTPGSCQPPSSLP